MHIQRRNQQVNRRHIKLTYLLTAPEPAWGLMKLNYMIHSSNKNHRPFSVQI